MAPDDDSDEGARETTVRSSVRDALDHMVAIADDAGMYEHTAEPRRTR